MRAASYATAKYEQYIKAVKNDFRRMYTAKCLEAKDSFMVDYNLQEYHYTLYYYDLAGNLIQTVPPAGVNFVTGNDLIEVDEYRKHKTGNMHVPSHTLKTQYRYNSLNEVVWQSTPDGGESNFWYDRLGRMVVSQNAEQKLGASNTIPKYSYTQYDALGRISEVGELASADPMSVSTARNQTHLDNWLTNKVKTQITKTWYDHVGDYLHPDELQQNYLRGRVSAMAYYESEDTAYQHAIHYSYDIHGNVKELLREHVSLHEIGQGYKYVSYDYDLVSGNVNKVYYQKDKDDRQTHWYVYDADNRLTEVKTSTDDVHFETDAAYFYYDHGPLARVLIGENEVQGVDYAYTIHGWLKAVNGNNLDAEREIGQDGMENGLHANVARDVFGFSLGYYTGDYKSVKQNYGAQYFLMNESGSKFQQATITRLLRGA